MDILTQKSEEFIFGEDDHIIQDLIDTANAHKDICVGLAAVQIGYHKRVFVVWCQETKQYFAMVNPRIYNRCGGMYKSVEGCLSVDGEHEVTRHNWISIAYQTPKKARKKTSYCGWIAKVIQHEYDHLNGKLI